MKNLKNSKLTKIWRGRLPANVRLTSDICSSNTARETKATSRCPKSSTKWFTKNSIMHACFIHSCKPPTKTSSKTSIFPRASLSNKNGISLTTLHLPRKTKKRGGKIYPEFMETAKKEGFNDIAGLFENLIQVETCHEKLFLDLHEQLKDSTLYKRPKAVKWKCSGCGYETTAESAPKECPLCHAKQGAFMLKLNDGN